MHICMDWQAVTFDWNRTRAFLVTAEEGSLSAAARALGMAQPTLGRQVTALEEELGVTLFERVGRGLELTEAGRGLLDHARAMGKAATGMALAASGQNTALDGPITISASEAYAAYILPPLVGKIRAQYPSIAVHIVASNDISDLRRREADIAIRNSDPTEPDLIAKRLPDDLGTFYATPELLKSQGPFDRHEALVQANFLGFNDNETYRTALREFGFQIAADRFQIFTANHLVHWELTRAGLGIGVMSCRIGDATPGVERAAPWLAPFPFPVWLVTHRELRTSRRVRVIYDVLAQGLRT